MSFAPVLLPVRTLWFAGRFLLPLALWFSAGRLGHYLLIQGGTTISHGSFEQLRRIAALLIFTLVVLLTVTVTIGMLAALRPGLRSGQDEDHEPFPALVGRALFPFVIIYLAWNLFTDDLREFQRVDLERHLFDRSSSADAGKALIIEVLWVAVAATLGAWALKALCERWYDRSGNGAVGMVTAFFECAFAFFGVSAAFASLAGVKSWITGRVVWDAASTTLMNEASGFMSVWKAFGGLVAVMLNTLVLPMIWFTVAALAYGVAVAPDDHRAALAGTRLEGAAGRVAGTETRRRRLADVVTVGFRERWVPFVYAVRLMARAGAPVYGMFVLSWVVVDFGAAYAFRGVLHLIGPGHVPAAWPPILVPIDFATAFVTQVLHAALLVATFDLVISRAGEAEVSDETAAPAPEAAPSDSR